MFASNAARIARTGSPPSANSSLQAFASSLVGSTSASTPTNVASNLVLNGQNLGPYGWVSKTTSQTISAFTVTDWFTTTTDQAAFVIINGGLTINSGITFTPSVRKKFLCIYVNGTLTLNGSISMTRRGAADTSTAFIQLTLDRRVDQTGGAGGASRSTNGAGNAGSAYSGTYYGTGGGGGGPSRFVNGQPSPATGGSGSAGNAFSGGSGGGGSASTALAGGNGVTGGGGGTAGTLHNGGCGTPSGAADGASTVEEGTGGVVIVFATGGVTGSGSIVANGANNTGINNASVSTGGGGGGASGGGCALLFSPSNAGCTLTANGGAATVSGTWPNPPAGGNGGNGSTAFVVI